jgi:hypothetical protein
MSEFSMHPHRLPGSENFDRSFDALKGELEKAGLEPKVQTYDTLVPRTKHCRLKLGNQLIEPVHPVNGGLAPLHTNGELSGPLRFLGDGSLDGLDGKDVEGCIAVLDLGAPGVTIEHVFPLGAKAVIFIGSDRASQWSILRACERGPIMAPRVYVSRETAEKSGLLQAEGQTVTLDAQVEYKDVVARNLWVELSGEPGSVFALNAEEAVVLSARLDTFGFVPDYTPDLRFAANAALLADVICQVAKQPRKRSVVAVFFGAHYGAQEGSRHFYYAVRKADGMTVGFDYSLDLRAQKYQRMLEKNDDHIRRLDRMDILDAADDTMFRLTVTLKTRLVGWLNNINADYRDALLAQRKVDKEIKALKNQDEPTAALEARSSAYATRLAHLLSEKDRYNDLRRQISGRHLEGDEQSQGTYAELTGFLKQYSILRGGELRRQIDHNHSFQELASRFESKVLVGHFDFDFANSSDPWCLGVSGAVRFYLNARLRGGLGPANYLLHFSEMRKVFDDMAEKRETRNPPPFGPAFEAGFKPASLCYPGSRSIPSAVALSIGAAGFQMMTVGEALDTDGLPSGTSSDLSGLVPQMAAFVEALGNRPEFSLRGPAQRMLMDAALLTILREERDPRKGDLMYGTSVQSFCKRSREEAEGTVTNVLAVLIESGTPVQGRPGEMLGGQPGITRNAFATVRSDGRVFMPSFVAPSFRSLYSVLRGSDGGLERFGSGGDPTSSGATLAYVYGGGNFSFGFAPDMLGGGEMATPKILSGSTDALLQPQPVPFSPSSIRALFIGRETPLKWVGSTGEMLLGSTEDAPSGLGVPLDGLMAMDTIGQAARDYWLLNETRLQALRGRNIINDPLEKLHAEAQEHLDEAASAREIHGHKKARAHHIFATCLENRAYRPLQGVTQDLVRAVLVLLLLNLPFAFAMERLIFGFTSIYKQVLGFSAFFSGTFAILYFTHPAFALAQRPVVILLAFIILALGVMTLRLILGKIKLEIRAMQGLGSTVHGLESNSSTSMAAVLIGISGMRNRPLKTFLTGTTVILLTFTILVFASFTAELGVVENYLGQGRDEDRIELHRTSCLEIPEALVDAIDELHGDQYHVMRRSSVFRNPIRPEYQSATPQAPERVILHPKSGKIARLEAFLGVEPAETGLNTRMEELLPDFASGDWPHPPMYLPGTVAEGLGARVGDDLSVMGRMFTFAGAFDSARLRAMTTIEGLEIVPPDFAGTITRVKKGLSLDSATGLQRPIQMLEGMDIGRFEWTAPEKLAITDQAALHRSFPMMADSTFIVLYPRSGDVDIENTARELAPVFQGSVHVKSSQGAKKLHYTKAVAGSGFGDIIVPLLLGGLIIFSSLLGSIVDREREIFTYSAMGLSPPSVAALFFAESGVYSVIGGMGGYLISQVVAKVLVICGELGWFHPPNMNFSSLTSVLTILVVMAVVMLSTIFPAIQAGKSANPGVARTWQMPAPEGKYLSFVFPFTVSDIDFTGILSFIKEHFENHADATVGRFAARNVELYETAGNGDAKKRHGIRADIALAPFDLGIFQKFRMYSKEFEIEGIDEIVVEIEQVGGTQNAWFRANRAFADELRQQFLLWRSLPIETVMHYRKETESLLSKT